MGPYAALQYLNVGRQLWYTRVAEPEQDQDNIDLGFVYASRPSAVILKEAVTAATLIGEKTNIVTLNVNNKKLEFQIDGSNVVLTVPLLDSQITGSVTIQKSMSDIAALLNADTNFAAYFIASLSTTGALEIQRLAAGSNHGFKVASPTDKTGVGDILGFSNVAQTAWGTGSIDEKAYIMANKTYTSFEADSPALNELIFVVDGAALATITLTDAIYSTAELLVAELNSNATFKTNLVASVVNGGVFISIKSASSKLYLMLGTNGTPSKDAGPTIFGNVNAAKSFTGADTAANVTLTSTETELIFTIYEASAFPVVTSETYTLPLVAATYTRAQLFAHINAQATVCVKESDGGTVNLAATLTASAPSNAIVMTDTGSGEYVVYDISASAFNKIFGYHPIQKVVSTTAAEVLTITAISDGTWGDNLAVQVTNVDVVNGIFDLAIYERGYVRERYEKLVKTPELLEDGTDNPKFVTHAINSSSQRVIVTNGTGSGEGLLPVQNNGNSLSYFTGGNDGIESTTNPSTFIGVANDTQSTGLQLFRNPEQLDINLIAVPGISNAAVINAMIDVCLFRKDCMCIVDPPLGLTPQNVVDWANGAGSYSSDHAAFNSSYAALYWPWLQIYDPVNRGTVWTPPSGHLSFVYAYTDYNSETWSAPAGLNRGHLTTPVKAEYIPTLGERDLLYSNNVNPIATFIRDGINVWGQKTLQRTPTALDRVNVRRLMLYLEKVVATAVRTLVFEPTDRVTWIQFINLVEPFLDSVKSRRGLLEYKVVCDETTNTPDVQDRNEMYARIYIRPTKTAEFISIDFILTDSGTAFSELTF
jgi:phage tail sheath protein FI